MTGKTNHIVVADDDRDIRDSLARYLRQHGYRVSTATDSVDVQKLLAVSEPDLVILDIMMPGEDGLALCRRIQESRPLPTIFLSALSDDIDRIVGLELGADDYVTKPFNPRELLARIKSVLRRSEMLPLRKQATKGRVAFDRWRFDLSRKEVVGTDDVVVRLSSGEHLLLVSLIEHAGTTLRRDQLLDLTKGREVQLFDRSIDNVISRLRRKLELDPKRPEIIVTQWGDGYLFAAELNSTP